jgi:hypothetical protein
MKNANSPAYPVEVNGGLTKREHIATKMLAARLTGLSMQKHDYMLSQVVALSIMDADELLKQLES